jgi:hypothetical protein
MAEEKKRNLDWFPDFRRRPFVLPEDACINMKTRGSLIDFFLPLRLRAAHIVVVLERCIVRVIKQSLYFFFFA